jgi:hypothetical protein
MKRIRRLIQLMFQVLAVLTPYGLLRRYWRDFGSRPDHFLDYVMICVFVDILGFATVARWGVRTTPGQIGVILAGFRILDLFWAFARPLYGDQYPTMGKPRCILLVFSNLVETVICFASIILAWGCAWTPVVARPIAAIYASVVTLTTLGFGDVCPMQDVSGDPARVITILEVSFQVIFITFGILTLTREPTEARESGTLNQQSKAE